MEVWRDVVGYECVYHVSNFGRVKRIKPGKGVVVGKVLSPGKSKKGIMNVNLSHNSRPKSHMIHRLVAIAFLGNPPSERHVVAHNDGNASNNRLANLRWATPAENSFDQVMHGTQKGKHYGRNSALTDDQIIAIRADHRIAKDIAPEYGLSCATISQIRRRKTHKHLPARAGDYVSTKKMIGFSNDEIRSIRMDTRKNAEVADEFGCSEVSIWSIKTKRTYAHVPDTVDTPEEKEDRGITNFCTVGDIVTIDLSQSKIAIVDLRDLHLVENQKWNLMRGKKTHYAVRRDRLDCGKVKSVFLHRLIMQPPEGMVVDHINGDGLDNRRANLRVVTVAQNNLNSRVRSDNVSGLKGAYYDKKTGSYYSRITVNGEKIHLGTFPTAEAAALAYADASKKHHGEYGRTHFD